ncbi:MAG: DUF2971 domain-containing protein [Luteolibacter sp.]|uniref:DUF2971 domain-containing protein n=1 Tax=Luteolibacter sp. TaxID=1962973 RepID=UPI0032666BB3
MKNPQLPPALYKFWGPTISREDNRIPFIESESLVRFTQPNSFNDPFESQVVWSFEGVNEEVLKKFIEEHLVGDTPFSNALPYLKRRKFKAFKHSFSKRGLRENPQETLDLLSKTASYVATETSGVLSLSGTWKASPMWAHYATNHEGMCIGFDMECPIFKHHDDNLVYKVEY